MILKHISRMLCLLISYSKFTRTSCIEGLKKIKYYVILSTYHGKQIKLSVIVRQLRRGGVKTMDNKQVNKAPQKSARLVLQAVTAIARSNANSLC